MLVSVSITSYNQRNQLIRAIESVLNQSYKNIQIIIADDHSTRDDSIEVIRDYQKKYGDQIKAVLQPKNVGIPANKNSGFRACDGDFITYLDGDDFYYPEKIEKELKTFKEKPWADIVYSNFAFTDLEGNIIKTWATSLETLPEKNAFSKALTRQFPTKNLYRCELTKKSTYEAVNYYDERIAAFHDWDFRIRTTKKFKIAYNNYIGSAYVDDPAGISKKDKQVRLLQEMEFVYDKNKKLLENLSLEEQMYLKNTMDHFFRRANLFHERSVKKTYSYFAQYPKDLTDPILMARLVLGDKLLATLRR